MVVRNKISHKVTELLSDMTKANSWLFNTILTPHFNNYSTPRGNGTEYQSEQKLSYFYTLL